MKQSKRIIMLLFTLSILYSCKETPLVKKHNFKEEVKKALDVEIKKLKLEFPYVTDFHSSIGASTKKEGTLDIINEGQIVTINYSITRLDGTVISSSGNKPFSFVVGEDLEFNILNKTVQYMALGERRVCLIDPGKWDGKVVEELKHPKEWYKVYIELLEAKIKIVEQDTELPQLVSMFNQIRSDFELKYTKSGSYEKEIDFLWYINTDIKNRYMTLLTHGTGGGNDVIIFSQLSDKDYVFIKKSMSPEDTFIEIYVYTEENGYLVLQKDITNTPIDFSLFFSKDEDTSILPSNSVLNLDCEFKPIEKELIVFAKDNYTYNRETGTSMYSNFVDDYQEDKIKELLTRQRSKEVYLRWDDKDNKFILK